MSENQPSDNEFANVVLASVDENGLHIPSLQELIAFLENGYRNIYGNDLILDQNSPNGQEINLQSQVQADYGEMLMQLYNDFRPSTASGRSLDRDASINGIARKSGSFTIQPIVITTNRAVTLQGLDDNYNNPDANAFTVTDSNGNKWLLIDTVSVDSGSHTLNFRANTKGEIVSLPNTITNIITPMAGVVSVNNPSTFLEKGVEEETDTQFELRRLRSFGLGSIGEINSVYANLYNLDGVSLVFVAENDSDYTDEVHDIPPHCVWVVIQGGDQNDIANYLRYTVSSGCNTKGEVVVILKNQWGVENPYRFDRPTTEELYIQFTVTPKTQGTEYDERYIKEQLVARLQLGLYEIVDVNRIGCLLKEINADLIYHNIGVSKTKGDYQPAVTNTNYNYIFSLSENNIEILNGYNSILF